MTRIAFVITDMGGGGAERVALSLIDGFLARGHDVDLVLTQVSGELLGQVPDRVRIVDLNAPRLRSALRPLLRYLRAVRPDAMQVSMWPLTIVGIVAAQLSRTGVRVVTSDHSTLSRQYSAKTRTLRFVRLSTACVYPNAKGIIAVSEGAAADLSRLSGIDPKCIHVIPNPVPVPPPNPQSDLAVDRLWRNAKYRILAVGKFKPEKNFTLLFEALTRLDPVLDWRLILLGDGAMRCALEQQMCKLGLANRIAMPGFVNDPSPFYRTATHFVLSSDFEGLPTVMIEALHAGLTIVSTDCESGPREIIGDQWGRLVPCGDAEALAHALAQALDQPADPETQRRRGQNWSGMCATDRYLGLMGLG